MKNKLNILDNEWISTKEALSITKQYMRAPQTQPSLVLAGQKGKFIKKTDGFHWKWNKKALIEYCELSNHPTLLGIAKSMGASVGVIKYIALKNNIQYKEKMGRKFLTMQDCEKLMNLYKEHINGKTKKN